MRSSVRSRLHRLLEFKHVPYAIVLSRGALCLDRCLPKIIGFSNNLCYDNRLIPLRVRRPFACACAYEGSVADCGLGC